MWNKEMKTETSEQDGMREQEEDSPTTTTWAADFLLREGLGREVTGKWLMNEAVPVRGKEEAVNSTNSPPPE